MELSVFTALFSKKTFKETLTYLNKVGIESVEMAAGGFPGKTHCNPKELLADKSKLNEFKSELKNHNIKINSLSCHGNPVHPNKEIASIAHEDFYECSKTCK